MTVNQKKLLQLLRESPTGPTARAAAQIIRGLYFDEFGQSWTYKEIEEAKRNLGKHKKKNLPGAVEFILDQWADPKDAESITSFIGTREVKLSDYSVYCRGLYWLAGFELLQN